MKKTNCITRRGVCYFLCVVLDLQFDTAYCQDFLSLAVH